MDPNELVEQLLQGRASPEVLSEMPDAKATAVIERLQEEADRLGMIDPHRALKMAVLIIAIGQARSDPRQSALGMLARGDALKFLGQKEEAWEALEQAGNMFQAAGDEVGWARTRISLLPLYAELNRLREEAERARAIFMHHADQERLMRLDWQIASVYNHLGDHRQAVHHYQAALATAEALGETGKKFLPSLYMDIDYTYRALGDAPQALANLEHARRALSSAVNETLETEDCHKARKSLQDMVLGKSPESDEFRQAEAHVATCPFCQLRIKQLAMEIVIKPEGTCSAWRDQLHDYVEAQLAGHEDDPEFMDLHRHLDACVDCAEAYALLYETMWAEQQGTIPEPSTMPTLDTSFLSSKPAADSSQHELIDHLRNAYKTNDSEELNRVWGLFYNEHRELVSSWVKSHPYFESSGEDADYFVKSTFARMFVSLTRDKLSRFSNLESLLRYLRILVASVFIDYKSPREPSAYAAEEMDLTPSNEASRRELWEIIRAKLTDEKEYLVLYDSFLVGLKPIEIFIYNQETFQDLDEIYASKQHALAHLRRDPEFKKFLEKSTDKVLVEKILGKNISR